MEGTRTHYVVRLSGNLSLLAAMFACLILWGGIVMLMGHFTPPQAAASPIGGSPAAEPPIRWEEIPEIHRSLANLLLLWAPVGLGAVACATGLIALVGGREQAPETSRRAVIAILLSVIPGCLCTLWYLVVSAASLE